MIETLSLSLVVLFVVAGLVLGPPPPPSAGATA